MDSLAEKRERVKKLRPIDDVFFEVLAAPVSSVGHRNAQT